MNISESRIEVTNEEKKELLERYGLDPNELFLEPSHKVLIFLNPFLLPPTLMLY